MDDNLEDVSRLPLPLPLQGPIGRVHADADAYHPPTITYKAGTTMNFYKVEMEYTMESRLNYDDAMKELNRLVPHQFNAYYKTEKERYGDHPPCSPPRPAAN